mmetsp:Transcript_40259/g.100134  ORF Transcript_40259/g.100134 Transcript_40259/m.100134 type:complete len:229 (-) Transcript_40259:136-822(-)
MHLLAVGRAELVDFGDGLVEGPPLRPLLVREPRAERVHVPLGEVPIAAKLGVRQHRGIGRDHKGRRAQRLLETAAEAARHGAAAGLVEVVEVLRGAAPLGRHAVVLVTVLAERLLAADVEVPRAEQGVVPVLEVGVVGLRVVRVGLLGHAGGVEGAPESRLVAVLLLEGRDRQAERVRLAVHFRRGREAAVTPHWPVVDRLLRGASDALLELVCKLLVVDLSAHRRRE